MTRRRTIEELQFVPPAVGPVVEWMTALAAAGDGWLNLLPGVPEEAVEEPPRTVFTALFGTAQAPVTMCTWMPGRPGRPATVGVAHPGRRRAVPELAAAGAALPDGWRLRQDHVRRGLVAEPPVGAANDDVLAWMLTAGEVLVRVPLTGSWQARVYLPAGGQPSDGPGRSTTS